MLRPLTTTAGIYRSIPAGLCQVLFDQAVAYDVACDNLFTSPHAISTAAWTVLFSVAGDPAVLPVRPPVGALEEGYSPSDMDRVPEQEVRLTLQCAFYHSVAGKGFAHSGGGFLLLA